MLLRCLCVPSVAQETFPVVSIGDIWKTKRICLILHEMKIKYGSQGTCPGYHSERGKLLRCESQPLTSHPSPSPKNLIPFPASSHTTFHSMGTRRREEKLRFLWNTEHIIWGCSPVDSARIHIKSKFECFQSMGCSRALSDLSCCSRGRAAARLALNECQTRLELKETHEEYQFHFLSYVWNEAPPHLPTPHTPTNICCWRCPPSSQPWFCNSRNHVVWLILTFRNLPIAEHLC